MSKTKISKDRFEKAASRIGQKARLDRGIIRGEVTLSAYRTSYGRLEFLVKSANGESEWVTESALHFNEKDNS